MPASETFRSRAGCAFRWPCPSRLRARLRLHLYGNKTMAEPTFKRIFSNLAARHWPPARALAWTTIACMRLPPRWPKCIAWASKLGSSSAAATSSAASPTRPRTMDRVSADHMGMLATVINALALQDALEKQERGHARDERHRDEPGLRALHPPPRHSPPGKRPRRHLRRRHRQSLFLHRHRGLSARHGDQGAGHHEGHQGGGHLRRRPGEERTRPRCSRASRLPTC